jgi:signal transduction histidine kinase
MNVTSGDVVVRRDAALERPLPLATHRDALPPPTHDTQSGDARIIARTTRLLALTTTLADVFTTEAVAEAVLEFGLGIVEATRGFVASVADSQLTMVAARGYSEETRARVMQVNEASVAPLADAARTGEPIWLENVEDYSARYPWAFASFGGVSGTQAHVAIPLMHRKEVIGCVGFSFSGPTAFGAADRAFTLLIGEVVAGALFRARRYDAEFARRAKAELVAASSAEVLGVVAHDLRNPLSLIDMTAQFLAEDDPPLERRREMLATVRRATTQMDRLVGDLLDAVRMQSGGLRVELREIDVGRTLRIAAEGHRALAERNGIALSVELPKLPACARGDEERVVQALGNLLGNALKFTRAGGTVSLSTSASATEVTFRVSDTGVGIPESELHRLFERFWQSRKGDRRGVGLGLAIVKGIIDAHDGRLWAESAVGVGSTFAFTLPTCSHAWPAA